MLNEKRLPGHAGLGHLADWLVAAGSLSTLLVALDQVAGELFEHP